MLGGAGEKLLILHASRRSASDPDREPVFTPAFAPATARHISVSQSG
jgi:hypothetical protein